LSVTANMSRSAAHDARNAEFRQAFNSKGEAKAAALPTGQVIPARCKEMGLPIHTEDIPVGAGGKLHSLGWRSVGEESYFVISRYCSQMGNWEKM